MWDSVLEVVHHLTMIVNADAKSLEAKENLLNYDKPSWHGLTIRQRLCRKLLLNSNTNCWEWQGSTTGNNNYGNMRIPNKGMAYVHRLSYVMNNGLIPDGMRVLHRCDNPICCNPEHLFLGTQLENIKDRDMKGHQRNKSSVNKLGYVTPEKVGKL